MNERSCPICGKLVSNTCTGLPIVSGTIMVNGTETSITNGMIYLGGICTGHPDKQERPPVPQAFYDAFKDEEK